MTTSLEETDQQLEAARAMASSLLSAPVDGLEPVGGGRNSRVYRVRLGVRSHALKVYFHHASDNRKRMETEFASLEFLWRNGVRNVPEPLLSSSQLGCAVYAWIEGQQIADADVDASAIDTATSFLTRLSDLCATQESASFRPASEACFSGSAIVDNLHRRLDPLLDRAADHPGLSVFLSRRFVPAFTRMSAWSREVLGDAFDLDLPAGARTLSPSDFGFHNALKTGLGEIFFLDFEYFGWDDPAKMVCDFLLHPAMSLPALLKRRFARSVVSSSPFSVDLARRVEAFYPLFGLKWCLILLNEFLPEQLLRRQFAGMSDTDRRRKQTEQLEKAERMLRQITEEHEHFPYLS